MKLKDVMSRSVESVDPESTLQDAAQKMRSMDVGALPVCQRDRLVGMITDRDITVRAVAQGEDPKQCCVSDAMTSELIYCFEDEDVEKAAKLMEEKQIRRLAVLDRNHRLCGMVSLGDLATRQRDEHMSAEILEQVSQPNQPHA